MTSAQEIKLAKLLAEGKSLREAAELLGRSRTLVTAFARSEAGAALIESFKAEPEGDPFAAKTKPSPPVIEALWNAFSLRAAQGEPALSDDEVESFLLRAEDEADRERALEIVPTLRKIFGCGGMRPLFDDEQSTRTLAQAVEKWLAGPMIVYGAREEEPEPQIIVGCATMSHLIDVTETPEPEEILPAEIEPEPAQVEEPAEQEPAPVSEPSAEQEPAPRRASVAEGNPAGLFDFSARRKSVN